MPEHEHRHGGAGGPAQIPAWKPEYALRVVAQFAVQPVARLAKQTTAPWPTSGKRSGVLCLRLVWQHQYAAGAKHRTSPCIWMPWLLFDRRRQRFARHQRFRLCSSVLQPGERGHGGTGGAVPPDAPCNASDRSSGVGRRPGSQWPRWLRQSSRCSKAAANSEPAEPAPKLRLQLRGRGGCADGRALADCERSCRRPGLHSGAPTSFSPSRTTAVVLCWTCFKPSTIFRRCSGSRWAAGRRLAQPPPKLNGQSGCRCKAADRATAPNAPAPADDHSPNPPSILRFHPLRHSRRHEHHDRAAGRDSQPPRFARWAGRLARREAGGNLKAWHHGESLGISALAGRRAKPLSRQQPGFQPQAGIQRLQRRTGMMAARDARSAGAASGLASSKAPERSLSVASIVGGGHLFRADAIGTWTARPAQTGHRWVRARVWVGGQHQLAPTMATAGGVNSSSAIAPGASVPKAARRRARQRSVRSVQVGAGHGERD